MPEPRQIDRYVLERELGKGAFGTVFRARHSVTGRSVALKLLHPHLARDAEVVERFFREARAAASTQSPHIVDVLDAGMDPASRSPFLALELLDGVDLEDHLATQGRLRFIDAARIAEEICLGLDAAHRRGIVHRDLKPANVFLVRREGAPSQAKILDFGMSKLASSRGQGFDTGANVIMGTPLYMAPEQLQGGARDADARVDLYAVGAILYQMISGQLPHDGTSLEGLLVNKLSQSSVDVSLSVPGVPLALSQVIARCLEPSAERRAADASEVARELAAYIASATSQPNVSRATAAPSTVVVTAPASSTGWGTRLVIAVLGLALLTMTCFVGVVAMGASGALWALAQRPTPTVGSPSMPSQAPMEGPQLPTGVSTPLPEPTGARVAIEHLGGGPNDLERATADRARRTLQECRTDQREREELSFIWMGMGAFGGSSALSYTPNAGQTETPVRECMRDAILNASESGTAMGIVTFIVTLEPR